ncbi:MAG: hypothetical protein U1F35_05435 [Steroidobacteraceae bacterium]
MLAAPFHIDDIEGLPAERLPERARDWYSREYVQAIAAQGPAFTGRINGKVVILAGIAYDEQRRGWLWSFLATDTGPHMLAITRTVKRVLALVDGPLFATADRCYRPSLRWLAMLGFKPSTNPAWPPGPDDLFERA